MFKILRRLKIGDTGGAKTPRKLKNAPRSIGALLNFDAVSSWQASVTAKPPGVDIALNLKENFKVETIEIGQRPADVKPAQRHDVQTS
jgi:hypothetical protein